MPDVIKGFQVDGIVYPYQDDNLAQEFDTEKSYTKGDYVLKTGIVYQCNKDNTSGAWDSQNWTQVKILDEVLTKTTSDSFFKEQSETLRKQVQTSLENISNQILEVRQDGLSLQQQAELEGAEEFDLRVAYSVGTIVTSFEGDYYVAKQDIQDIAALNIEEYQADKVGGYKKDDKVFYSSGFYICNNPTSGDWKNDDWTVDDELNFTRSVLNDEVWGRPNYLKNLNEAINTKIDIQAQNNQNTIIDSVQRLITGNVTYVPEGSQSEAIALRNIKEINETLDQKVNISDLEDQSLPSLIQSFNITGQLPESNGGIGSRGITDYNATEGNSALITSNAVYNTVGAAINTLQERLYKNEIAGAANSSSIHNIAVAAVSEGFVDTTEYNTLKNKVPMVDLGSTNNQSTTLGTLDSSHLISIAPNTILPEDKGGIGDRGITDTIAENSTSIITASGVFDAISNTELNLTTGYQNADNAIKTEIMNTLPSTLFVAGISSLPSSDEAKTGKIYFVGSSGAYEKFVWVNNNWERLGGTDTDVVTNYASMTDTTKDYILNRNGIYTLYKYLNNNWQQIGNAAAIIVGYGQDLPTTGLENIDYYKDIGNQNYLHYRYVISGSVGQWYSIGSDPTVIEGLTTSKISVYDTTVGASNSAYWDDDLGDSNKVVRSSVIKAAIDTKAPITSPNFTGIPTAPTPSNGDISDQIATTSFVNQALSASQVTVDSAFDSASNNAVYNSLITNKFSSVDASIASINTELNNTLKAYSSDNPQWTTTPVENSVQLVTSGGVYDYIETQTAGYFSQVEATEASDGNGTLIKFLDKNDEEVGSITVTGGGGGGGGATGETFIFRRSGSTSSSQLVALNTATSVPLYYRYQSYEGTVENPNPLAGSLSVSVNGTVVKVEEVQSTSADISQAVDYSIDVRSYLVIGTNNVVLTMTNANDNVKTIRYTIVLENFNLTWDLSTIKRNNNNNIILINYVLYGSGNKYIHTIIDMPETVTTFNKNKYYPVGTFVLYNNIYYKHTVDDEINAYNAEETYEVGDIVYYTDGNLYTCTTAIETAEVWNIEHWEATSINWNGNNWAQMSYVSNVISQSGLTTSQTISALSHGVHTITAFATKEMNNTEVSSNYLYGTILQVNDGVDEPIIAVDWPQEAVDRLSVVNIDYIVISNENPATVHFYINDVEQGSQTVDQTTHTWSYQPMETTISNGVDNPIKLKIQCGTNYSESYLTVNDITGIATEAENCYLKINPINIYDLNTWSETKSETSSVITDGTKVIKFTVPSNFGGGLTTDENGRKCIKIPAGEHISLNYAPFARNNILDNGLEMKFIYAIKNSSSKNAVGIKCLKETLTRIVPKISEIPEYSEETSYSIGDVVKIISGANTIYYECITANNGAWDANNWQQVKLTEQTILDFASEANLEHNITATYEVDDIVKYNNVYYRCITPIPSPGPWDPTCWEETSLTTSRKVGFELAANNAYFYNEKKHISLSTCEDELVELDINIQSASSNSTDNNGVSIDAKPLMELLESCSSFGLATHDSGSFYHTENIIFGSDDAEVYLYLVRSYEYGLAHSRILNNFINDGATGTEIIARNARNSNFSNLTIENVCALNPKAHIFVIHTDTMTTGKKDWAGRVDRDKKKDYNDTLFIEHYIGTNKKEHFMCRGAMAIQGTSAVTYAPYAGANLNFSLDTSDLKLVGYKDSADVALASISSYNFTQTYNVDDLIKYGNNYYACKVAVVGANVEAFSTEATYAINEYVSRTVDETTTYYKCKAAITTAGEWTGTTNWDEINPATENWNIENWDILPINDSGYAMNGMAHSVPTDLLTWKKNVASQDHIINILCANWYNDYQPSLREARKETPQIRDCLESGMCAVFIHNTSENTYQVGPEQIPAATNSPIESTLFYGLGNLVSNKDAGEVFDYDPIVIEVLDNGAEQARLKSNDLTESTFEKQNGDRVDILPVFYQVFEFRNINSPKAFDNTKTYKVGSRVIQNNKIYQCHTTVTTAGEWTGTTNWTQLTEVERKALNLYTEDQGIAEWQKVLDFVTEVDYTEATNREFALVNELPAIPEDKFYFINNNGIYEKYIYDSTLEDYKQLHTTITSVNNNNTITVNGIDYSADTADYRNARWSSEAANYFDMETLYWHFNMSLFFLLRDNRAKNMFWSYHTYAQGESNIYAAGEKRWGLWFNWDNDTGLCRNNAGYIDIEPGYLDTDRKNYANNTAYIFNGANNAIFSSLRANNMESIRNNYTSAESKNAWNSNTIIKWCTEQQTMFSEAMWMADMEHNAIKVLTHAYPDNRTNTYLGRATGRLALHIKKAIKFQKILCDSYLGATSLNSDYINFRMTTPETYVVTPDDTVTIKPYTGMFIVMTVGGTADISSYTAITKRSKNGEAVTFNLATDFNRLTMDDTVVVVYGATWIEKLSDLSPLYLAGEVALGKLQRVKEIKIGNTKSGYQNRNIDSINVSGCTKLESLNLNGVVYSTSGTSKNLELNNNFYLKYIDTRNSGVTSITFAPNGQLEEAHLNNIQTLSMTNLHKLTSAKFTMSGYTNLTGLTINNSLQDKAGSYIIALNAENLTRVRMTGINWQFEDSDGSISTNNVYNLLYRLYPLTGRDDNDDELSTSVLRGSIQLYAIGKTRLAKLQTDFGGTRDGTLNLAITRTSSIDEMIVKFYDYHTNTTDYDVENLIDTQYVEYNTKAIDPRTKGIIPVQTSTATYDYTFDYWTPTLDTAFQPSADDQIASVKAVFKPVTRQYTVKFKIKDNTGNYIFMRNDNNTGDYTLTVDAGGTWSYTKPNIPTYGSSQIWTGWADAATGGNVVESGNNTVLADTVIYATYLDLSNAAPDPRNVNVNDATSIANFIGNKYAYNYKNSSDSAFTLNEFLYCVGYGHLVNFPIGAKIKIPLRNMSTGQSTSIEFELADFNKYTLSADHSQNASTVWSPLSTCQLNYNDFGKTIGESGWTYNGGWSTNQARKYLNEEFILHLDPVWRSIMKKVVVNATTGGTNYATLNTSDDFLFLPCVAELGFTSIPTINSNSVNPQNSAVIYSQETNEVNGSRTFSRYSSNSAERRQKERVDSVTHEHEPYWTRTRLATDLEGTSIYYLVTADGNCQQGYSGVNAFLAPEMCI